MFSYYKTDMKSEYVVSNGKKRRTIVTARKRSSGQGNVFTPVCHSVHNWGAGGWLPILSQAT